MLEREGGAEGAQTKGLNEGGNGATRVRREVQGSKRLMYNILLVITDGVRGAVIFSPSPQRVPRVVSL